MVSKTFRNITALFISSAALLFSTPLFACGWSENSETVRLALFRAETQGMSAFRPFYYSASYFNTNTPDPEGLDQDINCREWQQKLGKNVLVADISLILYQTPPEMVEFAFQSHTLAQTFEGNTFISQLSKPENKDLLAYLLFAKQMEHLNFGMWGRWESWRSWNSYSSNPVDEYFASDENVLDSLPRMTDRFLQMRYAFMELRLTYQQHLYTETLELYNTYFENRKGSSIIQQWALLFKALSIDRLDDHVTANYLYSLVFDRCDEKKLVVMQNFNVAPDMIAKTMEMAKNDHERGVILAMSLLRNPGPTLDKLQQLQKLIPGSRYMQLLVMREINKLEDWIFTPMYTQYPPSVDISGNDWYSNYSKAREVNFQKDMVYLHEVLLFLEKYVQTAPVSFHDFLHMSLAHLYFMDDRIEDGKASLKKISLTCDASILSQKNIELALIELKSGDIHNETTRTHLLQSILHLQKVAQNDFGVNKALYSLLRIISHEFEKAKDFAEAGLLFMKSEHYKNMDEDISEKYPEQYGESYYWYIAYFDRMASVQDVDRLMVLIQKKEKSPFEKYLCKQKLGKITAYIELKGTLAFRNNDLDLAMKTFSELPDSFWQKNYEFSDYLNEDPFIPKCLNYVNKRSFKYHFNKTRFIKELIDLRNAIDKDPQNKADYCIKLAHAYYNCSYWGNAWMMVSYGQTCAGGGVGYTDYLFGPSMPMQKKIQDANYFCCTIARNYYQKAFKTASNDEQRAMASLMIHLCDYSQYEFEGWNLPQGTEQANFLAGTVLSGFYNQLKHTKTFAHYQCPLLDAFAGNANVSE